MDIDAIKCFLEYGQLSKEQTNLNLDNLRGHEKTEFTDKHIAFVIRTQDRERLNQFEDIIEDRGNKNKKSGLSVKCFRSKKVPFVNGNYDSSGKLMNGIEKLLAKAEGKFTENVSKGIFVVGTTEEIFNELWKNAKGLVNASEYQTTQPICFARNGSFQESLLFLMGTTENDVPGELRGIYIGGAIEIELVRQLIIKAGKNDNPVLIFGDTGTGKEIVAKAIHTHSGRMNNTFMAINCGAIPHTLFESELFGHVTGAFTDAKKDKKGVWQVADKGTLFLDEIGDLSLDNQAKILRALQESKIRKVGGEEEIEVDTRIIAATNRDLFAMVQTGQFREDLYYRLRGFFIQTPALRDHPDDIPLIAQFLWNKIANSDSGRLPDDILTGLQEYSWPGNVRELKMILSNLHGLFQNARNLTIQHLKTVFQYNGLITTRKSAEKMSPEKGISLNPMLCWRHLRRVFEVIVATKATINPLIKNIAANPLAMNTVYTTLQYRLDEIEMLCLNPLYFNSQSIFDKVSMLKSKLLYFRELLKNDPNVALKNWHENTVETFDSTISLITAEIDRFMENAGKN